MIDQIVTTEPPATNGAHAGEIMMDVREIRFVRELYPRDLSNPVVVAAIEAAIERYRTATDLPPLVLANSPTYGENAIADGYERWQAGIREEHAKFRVVHRGDLSDLEILKLAGRFNARHGNPLSEAEKRALAEKYFRQGVGIPEIADILAVSERHVREVYLADMLREQRTRRNAAILAYSGRDDLSREDIARLVTQETGIDCKQDMVIRTLADLARRRSESQTDYGQRVTAYVNTAFHATKLEDSAHIDSVTPDGLAIQATGATAKLPLLIAFAAEMRQRQFTGGMMVAADFSANLSAEVERLKSDGLHIELVPLAGVESRAEVTERAEIQTGRWISRLTGKIQRGDGYTALDAWLDCAAEVGDLLPPEEHAAFRTELAIEYSTPPESRQHTDVWSFTHTDDDSTYPGRLFPQIVENLLWFYTKPSDIVVDPFVGGGTTIKVAKAMGRRVWSSDIRPYGEFLPIHEHNILDGWPRGAPDRAELIFLDPPYWNQGADKYPADERNPFIRTLAEFKTAWERVVEVCVPHLIPGGRLAYIIAPTVNNPEQPGVFVHHAINMLRVCEAAGLTEERWIMCTYAPSIVTAIQVDHAREQRKLLNLYRDLVVLQRGESEE